MKAAPISPRLAVAHQLTASDLEEAKRDGYRSVINNRPDGEAEDQPPSAALEAEARRQGLDYRHIPVVSGQLSDQQVDMFREALAEMPGPVLAFCRTGTRSTSLWALAAADTLAPEDVLRTASAAGYDLEALRPRLEAVSSASRASKRT